MFYNDVDLSADSDVKININQEEVKLFVARRRLIEELRKIRNNCLNINEEKVQSIRDELNNESIVKVLR